MDKWRWWTEGVVRIAGCVDRWIDGWMDEWMDG